MQGISRLTAELLATEFDLCSIFHDKVCLILQHITDYLAQLA